MHEVAEAAGFTGLVTMKTGPVPTLIGLPGLFVARLMGVTVCPTELIPLLTPGGPDQLETVCPSGQ
jgi:hypothetical protein